jgi:hypothetical protein
MRVQQVYMSVILGNAKVDFADDVLRAFERLYDTQVSDLNKQLEMQVMERVSQLSLSAMNFKIAGRFSCSLQISSQP